MTVASGKPCLVRNSINSTAKRTRNAETQVHVLEATRVPAAACRAEPLGNIFPGPAADDVVRASLKSLELGETICVPALEDSGLLDAVSTAEREMFETSRPGTLARRYRE